MKASTRTTLAALAALLIASVHARAQEAPDTWFKFAPEPDGFVALMPARPAMHDVRIKAGVLTVAGRAYVATGEGETTYMVLALDDREKVGERLVAANKDYVSARFGAEGAYLDEIAEVAWEALVRPEIDRRRSEGLKEFNAYMEYRREFELGGRPAREYLVVLHKAQGPVYVCADGARVYVVAALGPAAFGPASQSSQLTRFVESFGPTPPVPSPYVGPASAGSGGGGPGRGGGVGAGGGGGAGTGEIDYTRPFTQKDVGQRAVIVSKPDPGFPESARKFNVTGVVRLRAILDRTGEVTNIVVLKGLPHGLTTRAVNAARQLRFKPARKDGRDVSQYVTFEYNFNIY